MADDGAFERKLAECRRRHTPNGTCRWRPGEPLKPTLRKGDVPNAPGAYVLSALSARGAEVVYIGRGGEFRRETGLGEQGILGRLAAKAGKGVTRKQDYTRRLEAADAAELGIEWFVTWDAGRRMLPALVEAELVQAYLDDHGTLPPWNQEF